MNLFVNSLLKLFSVDGCNLQTGYAEMQENGNFVLVNDLGSIFWNITVSSDGAYMLLQENGNLMIRSKDGSKTLWQTNKPGSC